MDALKLHTQRLAYTLHRLTFRPYIVNKRIAGEELSFFVGDYVGKQWYGSTVETENKEIQFLRYMTRRSDKILEVGAHHGLLSVLFSRWAGAQGRVIAVEPVPNNTSIIVRNAELNGCCNVQVDQAAVGAVNGWGRISHRSNANLTQGGSGPTLRVPVRTLNWYAGERPTLVKLDVEGYEVQALRAAGELLTAGPRWAIEVHIPELAQRGESPDELLEHLAGYELWLQPRGEVLPRPYQGERLSALVGPQVHLYAFPR